MDTEIVLSERTTETLKGMVETIRNLNDRMQIICSAILMDRNIDGNYALSPDCTRLVLQEPQE